VGTGVGSAGLETVGDSTIKMIAKMSPMSPNEMETIKSFWFFMVVCMLSTLSELYYVTSSLVVSGKPSA
jgi:hypothetical protein